MVRLWCVCFFEVVIERARSMEIMVVIMVVRCIWAACEYMVKNYNNNHNNHKNNTVCNTTQHSTTYGTTTSKTLLYLFNSRHRHVR